MVLPKSRLVIIVLFLVVIVGLWQMMYLMAQQQISEAARLELEEKLKNEILQLRTENDALKQSPHSTSTPSSPNRNGNTDANKDTTKNHDDNDDTYTFEDVEELLKEKEDLTQMVMQLQRAIESSTSSVSAQRPGPSSSSSTTSTSPRDNSTVITNYAKLITLIETYNTFGEVRNADKFTLEEGFIPIVIRVFNKHEYFGFALENYKKVKGIEKTMLIISHDGIFPEMFKLVEAVDFCQVKQLLHPFSPHILQNRFPGPDEYLNMDHYNNPRPPGYAALKHHYWWHLNQVWDQFLPDHNGDMVFMEEDHIPTTDFYQTIKAIAHIREERCPQCFNAKAHQHGHSGSDMHGLFLSHDLGNVAFVMPRQSWEKLRAAGEAFCKFDDYNWDWTLVHLSTINAISSLSLTTSFPRAEHLGKCGTHAGSSACAITATDKHHFEEVNQKLIDANGGDWSKYNFNERVTGSAKRHMTGWGGWAHPWDHRHCIKQIKKR